MAKLMKPLGPEPFRQAPAEGLSLSNGKAPSPPRGSWPKGNPMNSLREPDAGKPPVRFDEGETRDGHRQ